jgi:hypothetical protein
MKKEIIINLKVKRKNKNFWSVEDDIVLNPKDAVKYINDKYI